MTPDDHRDAQLRMLSTISETLTNQMAELVVAQRNLSNRANASEEGMKRIEKKIDDNTMITEAVRDVLTAGKVATQFIKWTGVIGGAFAGIWAAVSAIKGGPPVGGP